MPRIKKVFPTLPKEVLKAIARQDDTLLPITSYGKLKIGDFVTIRGFNAVKGPIVGFVTLGDRKHLVYTIIKREREGGRYDHGYFVYIESDLTKIS